MADAKDDVQQVRKYSSGRYVFRQIPWAAAALLLGLATQIWPAIFPWQGQMIGALLALAGLGYILFALFRRFVEPGRPRLVLAPDGIFQRLSHGRILHIPWDEVQDVKSVTQRLVNVSWFVQTILHVPAVVVSEKFYDGAMPAQPWHKLPLNWGHFAEGGGGKVRVLFRPAFLGTTGKDLRAAIESRWRAFSRHPNAQLPPEEDERGPEHAIPSWVRRLAPLAFIVLAALPALYFILSPKELSEGMRSGYLADLLDRTGVPARLADGRIARLRRSDLSAVAVPECPETTRSDTWFPSYVAAATCIAVLTLPSGERATAVFRLGTKTFTVEYQLGAFREERATVTLPLSAEEADALLCRLGHCGPGGGKR
ncbi:MAG: hypothetical protein AB7K35_10365 [Pseudorhodoplanes sp.]